METEKGIISREDGAARAPTILNTSILLWPAKNYAAERWRRNDGDFFCGGPRDEHLGAEEVYTIYAAAFVRSGAVEPHGLRLGRREPASGEAGAQMGVLGPQGERQGKCGGRPGQPNLC